MDIWTEELNFKQSKLILERSRIRISRPSSGIWHRNRALWRRLLCRSLRAVEKVLAVRPSHVLCEKFYVTGCLEKNSLNSKINCLQWMTYMNLNVSSELLWSFYVANHDDSEGVWNVGLPPLLWHSVQPGRQSRQLYATAALYSLGNSLLLISVVGWVYPRATGCGQKE
jgi:hypothetical protein